MLVILKSMMSDPFFALLATGQFISWIGMGYVSIYCISRVLKGE